MERSPHQQQNPLSEERIQALIQQLVEAESAVSSIVTGQVDAILDPATATPFLLHQARTMLHESEARYRRLLSRMSALIFELAPSGEIRYANSAVSSVTGYSLIELEGQLWQQRLLSGTQRRQWHRLVRRWQSGDLTNQELEITARDGRRVMLELTSANRYRADGSLQTILACAIDISERKAAQRQVEELTQHQRLILNAVGDGIFGIDRHARITFSNPAAGVLLEWPAEDLAGSSIERLLQPPCAEADDRQTEATATIRAVLEDGVPRSVEETSFWTRSGRPIPVTCIATPLRERKRITGVVVTFKDITQRKAAEEALRKQIEAQEALRLRDEFLTITAHELKTPITAIVGYAQLLQRRVKAQDLLPQREQILLQSLIVQTGRLHRMVRSLLDLSRHQLGQLTLDLADADVCAILMRIVGEHQLTLQRHAIELNCPAEPLIVAGDELRLEQVFQNLIQNAVKYSPDGGPIMIALTAAADQAIITVRDQGIGIPQEAIPNLFDRFYRAPNANSDGGSGMGIGLAVVKEIISLHHGAVEIESREGQGTQVRVLLPLKAHEQQEQAVE